MKKIMVFVVLICLLTITLGTTASAGRLVATQPYEGVEIRNQLKFSAGRTMTGGDYVKDINTNAYFDDFISGVPYQTRVYVGDTAACATMTGWTGATRTADIYSAYRGLYDTYTYKMWFKNTANPGQVCYLDGNYYYYAQ